MKKVAFWILSVGIATPLFVISSLALLRVEREAKGILTWQSGLRAFAYAMFPMVASWVLLFFIYRLNRKTINADAKNAEPWWLLYNTMASYWAGSYFTLWADIRLEEQGYFSPVIAAIFAAAFLSIIIGNRIRSVYVKRLYKSMLQ